MEAQAACPGPYFESIDPSTEEVIGRFEGTTPGELPRVIEHARRAQQEWARLTIAGRAKWLDRLADVFQARHREIAEIVSRENGKPLAEALLSDVLVALDSIRWHARNAARILAEERVPHHNLIFKGKKGRLTYEPYGVIAVISPWNYPIAIPFTAIVPALVAGNAVVAKPSELVPWCGVLVGELFDQAGFPVDLVQVIQGDGALGRALIEAGPDKVLFTGSLGTGKQVAAACARGPIPSVLELGGKDAMIVLADADLNAASSAAVWGSCTNAGQACLSVERIYVEPGAVGRFTELCVEKTKALRLGSGLDPDTDVGPMIRRSQIEKVERQLKDAKSHGARILAGGRRRTDRGALFFEPTVVMGVDSSMLLMKEETFGPVLAIQSVADAAEAVRLANESSFGLGACVWTRDRARGESIANQLRAGSVMINDVLSCYGIAEAPHGGRGASGWGRTHGRLGLLETVQVKYIDRDVFPPGPKPWWFPYDSRLLDLADGIFAALFTGKRMSRWRALGKTWSAYRARR